MFRTSDRMAVVHESDPAADIDGARSPDESWLLADGQPVDAARFVVRPLNSDEFRAVRETEDPVEQINKAAEFGLVSAFGEPAKLGELTATIVQELGALVIAVTTRPTAGRSSRLMAEMSRDSNATS